MQSIDYTILIKSNRLIRTKLMKEDMLKRILNIVSLLSLICGGVVLMYGLTIHYEYTNIDFYENIIKACAVVLLLVLIINSVLYKKFTVWNKNN